MLRLPKKKEKLSGFTIIEMMVVVAIIGTLAAIAIPNYLAYRDKGFCTSVEFDGGTVLSSLACYFAEPENMSCRDIESLENDADCGFSLNENLAHLEQIGGGGNACWIIRVSDLSSRCPRSTVFSTYMGTSADPGWE